MTLTPDDIEHQVFKERFRGYDQDEVDRFLDRVAARITELTRERDELSRRLRELERDAAEGIEAEHLLKRTLIAAQRTADETVAEARSQAEQSLADARAESERVLADARHEALGVREQARAEARRVSGAVEELERFRAEYRERVRTVVAEQLALLERAGELPELPPGLRAAAGAMQELSRSEVLVDEPRAGDHGG